jgi:hypothetical protein
MRQKVIARASLLAILVSALTACGAREYRPDFVEQACAEEGSVYWIKLISSGAVAKRDAILAEGKSAGIVKRASAIIQATEIKVVFTNQGVSFHGFSASPFSVSYKDVTYLRLEDRDGNRDTLVIDFIESRDTRKETIEQGVSGLSAACIDGLQDFLAGQGVTLST